MNKRALGEHEFDLLMQRYFPGVDDATGLPVELVELMTRRYADGGQVVGDEDEAVASPNANPAPGTGPDDYWDDGFLPPPMRDPQFRNDVRQNAIDMTRNATSRDWWADLANAPTEWLEKNVLAPLLEKQKETEQ